MPAPMDRVDRWRRSSYSGTGNNCVELRADPSVMLVRDSKNPHGGVVRLPAASWRALARRVKGGEYDL